MGICQKIILYSLKWILQDLSLWINFSIYEFIFCPRSWIALFTFFRVHEFSMLKKQWRCWKTTSGHKIFLDHFKEILFHLDFFIPLFAYICSMKRFLKVHIWIGKSFNLWRKQCKSQRIKKRCLEQIIYLLFYIYCLPKGVIHNNWAISILNLPALGHF